mmetsp:Transcript_40786/g.161609  ORF Transcript_40786/g.161609 Transcript_40786/m.161609 type:complete len:142 (-) Transcript_40786:1404-1829(-)
MNIEAELEARLDGLDVSEVLADGTYIPDPGAREALGSLHALRVVSHASEVSELKGDAGELRKWCTKSIESLDATAFETSRIMDAVTAIRSAQMGFLAVKKIENRKGESRTPHLAFVVHKMTFSVCVVLVLIQSTRNQLISV